MVRGVGCFVGGWFVGSLVDLFVFICLAVDLFIFTSLLVDWIVS